MLFIKLLKIEVDIKEILYDEIDKVGKDQIKSLLHKDLFNSKSIIDVIFNNCLPKLNTVNKNEDEYVSLGEALLHFLLTVAIIPSERKITINNMEVSIIIPNLKNLNSNHDDAIIIQFLKDKYTNPDDVISKLLSIQPNRRNIWLVSSKDIKKDINEFVISRSPIKEVGGERILNFNEIIVKIDEFLKNINYTGFKILS